MKWIGTQTVYDNIRLVGNATNIEVGNIGLGTLALTAGDITLYDATNDGNPTVSIGSSATERLEISTHYESGAQGLDVVRFTTYTEGGSANDARFSFFVDEVNILQLKDAGVNIPQSLNLSIGGVDILTDSSGTTTLNNIDDLDATTIATFNSHLTAGDITGVTAGTGLSGGGTSGTVTLNVSGVTMSELSGGLVQTSTESFSDDDTSLMTSAAINDKFIDRVTINIDGADIDATAGDFALTLTSGAGIDIELDGTEATINGEGASTTNQGIVELATTAETTTGTSTTLAVTPDGLKDGYGGSTNVRTLGTITTGTWEGTDIASDQQKHLMHYRFMGYGTGDGTNYFAPQPLSDNQAPWEHADSSSSDGLTIPAGSGTNVSELVRGGGHVMINTGTLRKWTGWATCNGSAATYISIYKWTPVDNDNSDITPVLLDTATITAAGNDKARSFAETSFTQASVSAGDIIFTQIKTASSKTVYFNSTLEIEF